jgi:outer membrane biosynthesis protein TonB
VCFLPAPSVAGAQAPGHRILRANPQRTIDPTQPSAVAHVPSLDLTPSLRWSPAIAPSFVASLAIHVAIGVALFGLVSTERMAGSDDLVPLAVRLVEMPSQRLQPPTPAPTETIVSQSAEAAALPVPSMEVASEPPPQAHTPGSAVVEPPLPADARPGSAASVPASGTVAIAENYAALAGLSNELVTRTQGTYMPEVETPVRIIKSPDVVYPQNALKEGRQATVVVWLAIDTQGAIEEVVVDSDEQEFVGAVRDALPMAKFLPAMERGTIIPYYVVMQFDFRTAGATTTAAGAVQPGK